MYTNFCSATDAEEFYGCRTVSGVEFAFYCAADQVIYIRSAEVGFSPTVKISKRDRTCPLLRNITCTRSATNHSVIMNCHGERYCRIPQGVLNYQPHDKLCDDHQSGNFIKIKYDCVNPGKRACWFMYTFCFQRLSFPPLFYYWFLMMLSTLRE